MKRKLILTSVLVLLALDVSVLCLWWFTRQREPSWLGKPQSYWLEEYNRVGAMEKTGPVSDAFRSMGAYTVPYIMRCLQHTQDMAGPACLALKALGSNAAPAIPELMNLVETDDFRGEMGLLCLGSTSAEALVELCGATNEAVRVRAALTLARVSGNNPRDTISWGWTTSKTSGKPKVSLGTVLLSENIHNLTDQLEHPNASVRRASAETLKKYSKQARWAQKALWGLLSDPEPEVAEAARQALEMIDSVGRK